MTCAPPDHPDRPRSFGLPPGSALDAAVLAEQHRFSLHTFGPGPRAEGVVAHIRKELEEVLRAPGDLSEWVDVMILAADGAMRAGHSPADLLAGYRAKLERNFARTWPDWRGMPADQPIEHDRAADALSPLEEARELAADLYDVLADPREVLGEEVYARAGRVFGWAFKDGEVQT